MTTLPLTISSANCTADGNSGFVYSFPAQDLNIGKNATATLHKLTFSQSIFNVSAALGNNTFTLVDTSNASPRPTICTLNPGIYDSVSLPAALTALLSAAGMYTLSSTGTPIYYLSLSYDNVSQRWLLNSLPTPTSYASGTNPASLGTTGNAPQLIFGAAFGQLIGLAAGSYPPTVSTSPYFIYSTFAPSQPIQTLDLCLDIVNEDSRYIKQPSSLLTVLLDQTNEYGSIVQVEPYQKSPKRCLSVSRQSILLTFVDQLGRRILFSNGGLFVAEITLHWC